MAKLIHNFKIETPDGTYDMADDFGILVRSFIPDQPDVSYSTEKVPGRNGLLLTDRSHNARSIQSECAVVSESPDELEDLIEHLGAIMRKYDTFYVLPENKPGIRWVVSCDGPRGFNMSGAFGGFSLTFNAWQPFAESRGTSLDELEWVVGGWSWGQGLKFGQDAARFTTATFTVQNRGNVAIDPRAVPFVLSFTGASTNLRIRNLTTGDDWQYTGTTNEGDIVRQDSVRSTKNSLSIVRQTNRKLISLTQGANEFEITGATGTFTVDFYFRYYYL